jgi:energy-coupling factor transporter ATP-binding protein EcfA2
MRRIKLVITRDVEIAFSDSEKALKQIYEVSEKGTSYPLIIYGPEGCGKTSLLKQAAEIFREQDFETFYINPLQRDFIAHTDVQDLIERFVETLSEAIGVAQLKLASLAIFVVRELLTRWRRRKIAVLIDDVFQAIGLDKVETKELLERGSGDIDGLFSDLCGTCLEKDLKSLSKRSLGKSLLQMIFG